ncbi:transposase [Xenorhabdus bovienii]|nr:transposase [Xenorhabdus bovienii]MDE9477856.1 transposase [Xenorhabdus bovienii]MDE9530748.1 transposase [Xenorhabdus bovienii]
MAQALKKQVQEARQKNGRDALSTFLIVDAQAHESQSAIPLLDGIGVQRKNGFMKRCGKAVLADKGYSGGKLRRYLRKLRIKRIIPYKINEKGSGEGRTQFDGQTYRDRNVVERCFGFLKGNYRNPLRKNSPELSVHGEIRLYSTLLPAIIQPSTRINY